MNSLQISAMGAQTPKHSIHIHSKRKSLAQWTNKLAISILAAGSIANAGATLDRDVQAFLSNSNKSDAVMGVMITYKRDITIPNKPHSARSHAEIQKALMRSTMAQEKALFLGPLRGASHRTYWILQGTASELNRPAIQFLAAHPNVATISNSRRLLRLIRPGLARDNAPKAAFTYGLEKMEIPAVRQQYPQLDGSGIKVGILDTGIDPKHPDLAGKLLQYKDFTAAGSTTPSDEHGHGTHVAGSIAGGSTSGTSIGVAPKASLIVGKIFDATGGATDESIIAAMQWMADPDGNPNTNDFPQLVSNSWGDVGAFETKDPQEDPFCVITDNWVKLGMLPVFAAGNEGPGASTVGTPGGCPNALAVGATDSNDKLAFFSSRGPVKWKSGSLAKPNVSAPGVNTLSAQPGGGYQKMSGTSMATPQVSGVMALLYQAAPQMTVEQAAKALILGVKDLGTPGPDMLYGAGRVSALKSLEAMKSGLVR